MTNAEKFKTVEERAVAFEKWCDSNHELRGTGSCVRDSGCHACHFEWLDLEAEEEEKPLPCLYCGGETEVVGTGAYQVVCMKCMYASAMRADRDRCVSDHNRMARAVAAKKEVK